MTDPQGGFGDIGGSQGRHSGSSGEKRTGPNGLDPLTLAAWNAGLDDYVIPPREWLLGNVFCKGFLSSLLADGGVGKTALRIAQIFSLATNRKLTDQHVFRRCRCLIISFEDSRDELRRRVYAAMLHYDITAADIDGWLFLAAPKGLKLAQMVDGSPQTGDPGGPAARGHHNLEPRPRLPRPVHQNPQHGRERQQRHGLRLRPARHHRHRTERRNRLPAPHQQGSRDTRRRQTEGAAQAQPKMPPG